jgi:hypothetical protein
MYLLTLANQHFYNHTEYPFKFIQEDDVLFRYREKAERANFDSKFQEVSPLAMV